VARTPSAEYLVLDIETIPDTDRWQRPEAPPGGEAPAGRPLAAFPPTWAHRVVVIGWLWLDHGYRLKRFGVLSQASERSLLEDFARLVGRTRPVLVTYNGRGFDLPVIALRSLCHGVSQGWYYRERNVRSRYTEEGHLDLCDWLADHGATRTGSLDAVAKLIGLPGKTGIDGSMVEGLWAAGDSAAVERYCLSDVAQTALLFLRFRLLQGMLAPDRYQAATSALLDALAADGRVRDVLDGIQRAHLLLEWFGASPRP
jgi:3'-5' exonuclease